LNKLFHNRLLAVTVKALLIGVILTSPARAGQLVIEGLTEELEQNVRLVAGEFPTNERLVDIYFDLLPKQAADALAAYGYYKPKIEVKRRDIDGEPIINVNVELGEPVRVTNISLEVTGQGKDDPVFLDVLADSAIKKDSVFRSDEYESTKSALIEAAQARGFFNFKFVTNKVLISKATNTALVNLVADTGTRFNFGEVLFEQDVFSNVFLNRWVPFEPGDPYDAQKIAELTTNLQSSGYFDSVRVSPQLDVEYGPVVPLKVVLQRKDPNQVGLGVGIDSDEGIRGKISWSKPLLNSRGHSADMLFSASRISQEVSFAYRIPRDNQPLYNFWGLEYGLKNEDDDGLKSLLSTFNFQRVRRFRSDWQESVFIRWERERYTVQGVEDTTDLILPGIRYTRTRSKGAPFPTWGQSSSFQFMFGNRELLSTIDIAKVLVNFKYLREVSPKNTFIFSLQYGAINSNDYGKIPTSQRFFAGGDRSVRGYKYRTVSPLDAEGKPRGGRFLEAGSIEYNRRIGGRWGVAVFADIGRAFNNFSTSQKIGAGVGIRWQSPVGPFRLDLATPVNDDDNNDIQLHLSLGPDL
jgi:translocation and assembly module TamA